jgi:hypothetical protein
VVIVVSFQVSGGLDRIGDTFGPLGALSDLGLVEHLADARDALGAAQEDDHLGLADARELPSPDVSPSGSPCERP